MSEEIKVGNIPVEENYDFPAIPETIRLAGVSWENRQDIIVDLFEGTEVKLVRDPQNQVDKYAIKAMVEHNKTYKQIGWIPKELSFFLAQEMDNGVIWEGVIEKITTVSGGIKGIVIKLQYK